MWPVFRVVAGFPVVLLVVASIGDIGVWWLLGWAIQNVSWPALEVCGQSQRGHRNPLRSMGQGQKLLIWQI